MRIFVYNDKFVTLKMLFQTPAWPGDEPTCTENRCPEGDRGSGTHGKEHRVRHPVLSAVVSAGLVGFTGR